MKPTDLHPATRAERPFRRGSDEEKLFLAAVGMIPRHYRSFDMGCVMDDVDEFGTVCCFGGLVMLLLGYDLQPCGQWFGISKVGLGLGNLKAVSLFFTNAWPDNSADRLRLFRPRTPEYAVVAVERFMHFYRTGE